MDQSLATSPYSLREKAGRLLWAIAQACLFRPSFHNWYAWRRMLLRLFGATLDPVCRIRRTVRVECPWNLTVGHDSAVGDDVRLYCLGPVKIGDRVTISQGAHLCAGTHDYTMRTMPLRRPPIQVGDDAWICADAFIGPGVTIGDNSLVAAAAVVVRPVAPGTIVGGNPAVVIKSRSLDPAKGVAQDD